MFLPINRYASLPRYLRRGYPVHGSLKLPRSTQIQRGPPAEDAHGAPCAEKLQVTAPPAGQAPDQPEISGKRGLLAWRHPLPPPATRNLQFLQRATPSTTYLTIWHRPPGARHTSSLPTAPLSAPHQRSSDTQRHRKFIQTIT